MELELLNVAALHICVRVFMTLELVLHLGVSYINVRAPDWFRPF